MMSDSIDKIAIRRQLRADLEAMSEAERCRKSQAAACLLTSGPEFAAARVVMLFLSASFELDTAPIALKCWQQGKTVVVPKVSWNQRRMLPVEINSLQTGLHITERGIREPVAGKPVPVEFLDLVIVPGLGFSADGHRIGRGMGFYDRFLAQPDFIGLSCGLAFERQVLPNLPTLDHDMPLSMLVTEWGIRRIGCGCIQQAMI
jgi:5-formyltetrahydrofolate cyclo-ligase